MPRAVWWGYRFRNFRATVEAFYDEHVFCYAHMLEVVLDNGNIVYQLIKFRLEFLKSLSRIKCQPTLVLRRLALTHIHEGCTGPKCTVITGKVRPKDVSIPSRALLQLSACVTW